MVYAQIAAVWLIILVVVILIGWRAAALNKDLREIEEAQPSVEPQCPICHQPYTTGEFRGTMPHVCPPGEG